MPKPCPKCSQPTRTGAKYCGFCGTPLITRLTSANPQPQVKSNAACPHCNAPLRRG